jgi:tRNA pseudouridine38-40 synthase
LDVARYFIRLSYCGIDYNGWQSQPHPGTVTVQDTIEGVLSTLLRQKANIVGCGRTDTGVHARDYVAHFDVNGDLDRETIVYKANKLLPKDIAIHEIYPVREGAHARFDAVSRSYQYHLHTAKSPFEPYSFYYIYEKPNLEKLNAAAGILLEYTDFTTFCKLHSDVKTMHCKLSQSLWIREGDKFIYQVTSDRFLRGMIRLIVGMCLNVSRGKLTISSVRDALETQSKLPLEWSVPAEGLILTDICYDNDIRI